MIRFEKVTKAFEGRTVLDALDFEIRKGEVFSIAGPSGAGKSVTLKHMAGLLTPDSGAVYVCGEEVSSASGRRLEKLREQFGYLFQSAALLAWMSVEENIALPLREKTKLTEDEISERVANALELVGLTGHGDKYPGEISGGMRKRAGLARAIVREPAIVLYDEPTSGLDPITSRAIDRLILDLNRKLGITSVVVTHDLCGALLVSDRIALLKDGKFADILPPAQFVRSQNSTIHSFLGAQFIPETGVPGMRHSTLPA